MNLDQNSDSPIVVSLLTEVLYHVGRAEPLVGKPQHSHWLAAMNLLEKGVSRLEMKPVPPSHLDP